MPSDESTSRVVRNASDASEYAELTKPLTQLPLSFFLDKELFDPFELRQSPLNLSLPDRIQNMLSHPSDISEEFFTYSHLWMPMVSKNRWYTHHFDPMEEPQNHIKVLLLCMSLLSWRPDCESKRDPSTNEYLTAKHAVYQAERCGAVSLQLLQAQILLTMYEFGHGIYPAAYMNIAACVRYGIALGIHKQRREDSMYEVSLDEAEERRRVWWSIVILDCMLSPEIPCCPRPRPDDLLPVDDILWDRDDFCETDLYEASTPTSELIGPFARLAQGSYLIGNVLYHKPNYGLHEVVQFQEAFQALLRLTTAAGEMKLIPIMCPQASLCISAMLIMTGKRSTEQECASPPEVIDFGDKAYNETIFRQNMDLLQHFANESLLSSDLSYGDRPWSLACSSPLLIHYTYLIAVAFLKLGKSVRDDAFAEGIEILGNPPLAAQQCIYEVGRRGLFTMRSKLQLLGQHWCSAKQYLHLLDLRLNTT